MEEEERVEEEGMEEAKDNFHRACTETEAVTAAEEEKEEDAAGEKEEEEKEEEAKVAVVVVEIEEEAKVEVEVEVEVVVKEAVATAAAALEVAMAREGGTADAVEEEVELVAMAAVLEELVVAMALEMVVRGLGLATVAGVRPQNLAE